jgi:cell division protease FtsH
MQSRGAAKGTFVAGSGTSVAMVSTGRPEPGAGGPGAITQVLTAHLGPEAGMLPVASGLWPPYEHVNVQGGLDRLLEAWPGEHRLLGLTGFRHRMFGLADLFQPGGDAGMAVGGVAMSEHPSGPDGAVRSCVQCGVYLLADGDTRAALLLRGSDQRGAQPDVTLDVAATDPAAARRLLGEVRDLALEHSVYRRQVVSFGGEVFGPRHGGLLSFHGRPVMRREDLVLPEGLLDGVERQIVGVAQHRDLLLAHGQHLKRGVLLYGEPGVGKTHTVRYLMSRLPDVTVLILSANMLHLLQGACSIARALQPALIIVEDVDLIAEERSVHASNPALFQLLNEMDGLGEDVDVTFVLTTNRVDVLEPALVSRPGRIDHAVEIPLPDAEGRRRLLELYRGGLDLDLTAPELAVERTEGVTASFIKELLRRAALLAAEELDADPALAAAPEPTQIRLHVADRHLQGALDVLLGDANRLTRRLLGGGTAATAARGGADAG